MGKQSNAYPLRLDEVVALKIKALAKINDRSYKGQIENILKNYIASYEAEHGAITILPDE
jgi:hypothetical protein